MTARRPALTEMAWVTAVLHVGGLVALVGMRPGSALVSLDQRRPWLAEFPLPWILGWGVWILCAFSFLGFFIYLRAATASLGFPIRLVVLAGVALAVDVACDLTFIGLLPLLARDGPNERFLALERSCYAGGMVVANGLYTLAVVLASRWLARHARLAARTRRAAALVAVAGLVLLVGGLLDQPRVAGVATPPVMLAYSAWALWVARDVLAARSSAPA